MRKFNEPEDRELFCKLRDAFKNTSLSDDTKIILNTEYSNWATEHIPNAPDQVFNMRANDWLLGQTGLALSEPSIPNPIWNNKKFIIVDDHKFTYWLLKR